MKWSIYRGTGKEKGKPLHESITQYDGKGKVVYQDTFEYVGKWMGECYLTVSIKSPYPIDFQIGDYIEYRGEKFTINYDPTVIKKARRGTHGEGFVYDSIKFNSYSNELTMMLFHDWVLDDNKVHYTSLPTFSFYAKDVDDLVDRLQACADRWCKDNGRDKSEYWMFYTLANNTQGTKDKGQYQTTYQRTVQRAQDISTDSAFLSAVQSEWIKTYGNPSDYKDSRDDERYDRNISISNNTVWDGLQKVKTEFGLNFIIRGRNVYIGTVGIPTSHLFEYGKGKGLYEVDKTADNDQKVVTRLHAYGSDQNMPTRYYAELNVQSFGVIESVLRSSNEANCTDYKSGSADYLAVFYIDIPFRADLFNTETSYDSIGQKYNYTVGYIVKFHLEGSTDVITAMIANDKGLVVKDSDNNLCQVIVTYNDPSNTFVKDWSERDHAAFLRMSGALQSGKKIIFDGGIKNDAVPAQNKYYNSDNLPDNMAVNSLMLPGFPLYSLADICKSEYNSASNSTNYYIKKKPSDADSDYVLFHTESGKHLITFSNDRHNPYLVSQNAASLGYRDGDISCTESNDDNGLEAVYPTIEKVTVSDAGIGSGTARLDAIDSADTIDDNGVYDKEGVNIPWFHVTLPKLGFDLRQAAKDANSNGEFKLSMKDGFCGGREFTAKVESVDASTGKITLRVQRSYDDALSLWFPYSYAKSVQTVGSDMTNAYQILSGDHFVLTGIDVSDVNYVWTASVRLLRKAIHWLCKNDYTRYVYTPKIDEIFMARQDLEAKSDTSGKTASIHDTLKEGDILLFDDDDLLISGSVYIDQLTIKENGNNGIPTYDVTLRNEVNVGTLQRIQNKVDSVANDIRTGNIGGNVGMTPTQVDPLIKTYGDKYFLSKTHDDFTPYKLTMGEAEVKGDANVGKNLNVGGNTTVGGAATVGGVAALKGGAAFGTGVYKFDENGNLVVSEAESLGFDEALERGFGIKKNAQGKYTLSVTDLMVWGKAVFNSLEIRKLYAVGGNVYLSGASSKIVRVVPVKRATAASSSTGGDASETWVACAEGDADCEGWKCYTLNDDGTTATQNGWRKYDQAKCQTFDIKDGAHDGVNNTFYWRLVADASTENEKITETRTETYVDDGGVTKTREVTVDLYDGKKFGWVVLSKTDCENPKTNDAPKAGDTIVLDGHRMFKSGDELGRDQYNDETRTNVLMLETTGTQDGTLPRIVALTGIVNYKHSEDDNHPYSNTVFILSPKKVVFVSSSFEWIGASGDPITLVNFRGNWTDGTEYGYYDQVSHNDSIWTCVVKKGTKTTEEPSDTSKDWRKEISGGKGADGTTYDLSLSTSVLNGDSTGKLNTDDEVTVSCEIVKVSDGKVEDVTDSKEAFFTLRFTDTDGDSRVPTVNGTTYDGSYTSGSFTLFGGGVRSWDFSLYVGDKFLRTVSVPVVKAGADGKTVRIDSTKYKVKDSDTALGTVVWDNIDEQDNMPTDAPERGHYRYVLTIVHYTDGSSTSTVTTSYTPNDGTSVKVTSTMVEYAGSNNGTSAPTSDWQPTVPSLSQGEYLWTRTTVSYSDGNKTTSYSVGRIGMDGDKGGTTHILYASSANPQSEDDVRTTIDAQHQYYGTYQDTEINDAVEKYKSVINWVLIKGDAGHTPSVTIGTNGNWYIDNKDSGQKAQGNAGHTPTVTIGTDGYWYIDGVKTSQKAQGEKGVDGTQYRTVEKYAYGDSNTDAPAGGWKDSIDGGTAGQYLWNQETALHKSATDAVWIEDSKTTHCIGYIAKDGVSFTGVDEYYKATTDGTEAPPVVNDGSWKTSPNETEWSPEKPYLWNYEVVKRDKGDNTTTYPHLDGVWGEKGDTAVYKIEAISANADNDLYYDSTGSFTTRVNVNGTKISEGNINRGHNYFFLRGDTTPTVVYKGFFDTYGGTDSEATSNTKAFADFLTGSEADAYKDCVLVIVGNDAISVDDNLRNALKSYGYGGDSKLYNISRDHTSFVFIGQKGMTPGTAYYQMGKDLLTLSASVVGGVLTGKGADGAPGADGKDAPIMVCLYAVGHSNTFRSSGLRELKFDDGVLNSYGDWSFTAPDAGQYYLWQASFLGYLRGNGTYKKADNAVVSYVCLTGPSGSRGASGKDALEIVCDPETIVLDTDIDGLVKDLTNATAVLKCMRNGVTVSGVTYNIGKRVNCSATVDNNGKVKITSVPSQSVTIDGNTVSVSSTSGSVTVSVTVSGVTYTKTVPFTVNVARYTGGLKWDNKKLQSQYSLLTNDGNGGSITSLTEYKSEILQTAKEISLKVSEKSVGRRNMLVGSACRKYGDGFTYMSGSQTQYYNGYPLEQIEINSGIDGVNCIHCRTKQYATDGAYLSGFHWNGDSPQGNIKLEKGKNYVLSFYAKTNTPNGIDFVAEAIYQGSNTDTTRPYGYKGPTGFSHAFSASEADKWELFTVNLSVPSDAQSEYVEICIFARATGYSFVDGYICKPMLEEGDEYNGWTLSEQDYDYVGGNLLDGTGTLTKTGNVEALDEKTVKQGGYNNESASVVATLSPTAANNDFLRYSTTKMGLKVGDDCMLSFYARSSGKGILQCYLYDPSTGNVITESSHEKEDYDRNLGDGSLMTSIAPPTEWKRYWVHWRPMGNVPRHVLFRLLRPGTDKGSYNSSTNYNVGDVVLYGGTYYVCKKAGAGYTLGVPGSSSYWGASWFSIEIARPKLEVGATMTEWTEKRADMVDKRALLATGIDIDSKKIIATADNFVVRNNSGETTLNLDEDGKLQAGSLTTMDNGRGWTEIEGSTTIWRRADGDPGIQVFYDETGVPHLQFMMKLSDGKTVVAYDLGPTGLKSLLDQKHDAYTEAVTLYGYSSNEPSEPLGTSGSTYYKFHKAVYPYDSVSQQDEDAKYDGKLMNYNVTSITRNSNIVDNQGTLWYLNSGPLFISDGWYGLVPESTDTDGSGNVRRWQIVGYYSGGILKSSEAITSY